MKKIILTLISWLMLPFLATAANYLTCEKGISNVEQLICSSTKLSMLDVQLNVRYKGILEGMDYDPKLIQAQRAWLKERNRCSEIICLEKAYQSRIFELRNNYAVPKFPVIETARRDESVSVEDISVKQPYPDVWGYTMPEGISISGRAFLNSKGEYFFSISQTGSLESPNTYLAFFSGLQIETDNPLLPRRYRSTWNGNSQLDCPLPDQNKTLLEDVGHDNLCIILYEHTLKNGNTIRYIDVVGNLRTIDYDLNERYFEYFALYGPNGHLLKRITPIVLTKTLDSQDVCGEFVGNYTVNTRRPYSTLDPIWLEDDSFIVTMQSGQSSFILRLDKNLETQWLSMNDKGLFLVDTAQLEQLGHVRKNPKKSCFENEMDTDAAVANYLKHLTR